MGHDRIRNLFFLDFFTLVFGISLIIYITYINSIHVINWRIYFNVTSLKTNTISFIQAFTIISKMNIYKIVMQSNIIALNLS